MANYDTYLLAIILPPLVIVCTTLLTSYCQWGISYFMFILKKKRAEQNAMDGVIEYPGLQYMYTALQPVFGTKFQARKTRNRIRLTLYGQEIGPGIVPLLLQLVALSLGLSLAVFVTVLTIDIGHVCDEKLDCFPFNYSLKARPLSSDPIKNCSSYRSSDFSITCFHFTIRFVEALSSSGGILALTTLGINIYLSLLFTLARIKCCRKTGLCGCLLLYFVSCYILLSTLLWLLPLGLTHSEMLKFVTNWETVLIYYYTVMYLLLVATLLPCAVPRYRQDFGSCWSREQRQYRAPQTHVSDSDDEVTPTEASLPSQQRATGYYITFNERGRGSRPAGYFEERRSDTSITNHTNEVITGHTVQPSDSGSQSSQSTSTGASGLVVSKSPIVYQTKSVRGKLSKRKKETKGARGEVREGKRLHDGGSVNETYSTSSPMARGGGGHMTDSTETSAGSIQGEHEPQETEGRRRMDEREREVGSAQIREVLAGAAVDRGETRGTASVHTHL